MSDDSPTEDQGIDCSSVLSACSSKPNCVFSLAATHDSHYVAPLLLSAEPVQDWQRLIDIVLSLPKTLIVVQQANYLHAECKSRLFGFVDDLELCCDMTRRLCHVRSASRSGYYDFNVNRKRVETIRRALAAAF